MSSADVIKLLEKSGWVLQRSVGSHHTFKKTGVAHIITVPHPRKDVPKGLLSTILKQAGLK